MLVAMTGLMTLATDKKTGNTGKMITIDLNTTAILTAAVSIIISVSATWFFSRRHYTREQCAGERPATEYEAFYRTLISILRIVAITTTITVITTALLVGLFILIAGLQ